LLALLFLTFSIYIRKKSNKIIRTVQQTTYPSILRFLEYEVNSKGELRLKTENYNSLPKLEVRTSDAYPGDLLESNVFQNIISLVTLQTNDIAVDKVTVYNESYIELILKDSTKVLYDGKRDPYEVNSVIKLSKIDASTNAKQILLIDFRFEKPIIQY
jgi:hypothetical protein